MSRPDQGQVCIRSYDYFWLGMEPAPTSNPNLSVLSATVTAHPTYVRIHHTNLTLLCLSMIQPTAWPNHLLAHQSRLVMLCQPSQRTESSQPPCW